MKKRFIALMAGFMGVSSSVPAQYADLLNDRNISWVAEYTAEFSLNPVNYTFRFFDNNYELYNELNIIKLSAQPAISGLYEYQDPEYYFNRKILTGIREGAFAFFEDEALEIPMPKEKLLERLSRVDTFTGPYDEGAITITRYDISHDHIISFKARQVFYYNKMEKTFGSRLLALAPMLDKKDSEGNYLDTTPLVWLKMENPSKSRDKIEPNDFTYVFETKMKGNAPGLQGFAIKKGRMDFLTLIVNEVANPSHVVLSPDFKPIDPSKLQSFVLSTDTVTTYNPETFEENIEIVQRNAIKDVERMGFVQQWYYDDRKKLLFNRVVAVVPLIFIKVPEEGGYEFTQPLFYLLNE